MGTTKFAGYLSFYLGLAVLFVAAVALSSITREPMLAGIALAAATLCFHTLLNRLDILQYDDSIAFILISTPIILVNSLGITWLVSGNFVMGFALFSLGFSIICLVNILLRL